MEIVVSRGGLEGWIRWAFGLNGEIAIRDGDAGVFIPVAVDDQMMSLRRYC
jgi:hypothetical protein